MTKQLLSTALIATILISYKSNNQKSEGSNQSSYEVKTISAMKKVMMGEDLSAHVNWDSIPKEDLFAVAPLGRIQGEITVIDGKMYVATVDSLNNITIHSGWNIQSPFAVYTNVPKWVTFEVDILIQSEDELQVLIDKVASENGYDLNTAFPFRVLGTFSKIDYHIISKPSNELEHNHELHKKAKKHFHLENVKGELLGFYSKHHEGVFTHKGHYIHTHFIDDNIENMGHLENVVINQKIKIL
jgi:acetolactate decarboxylase